MGYRSTNMIIVTSAPVEVGPQSPELGAATLGLSARGSPTKVVAQAGRAALGLAGTNSVTRRAPQSGMAAFGPVGTARTEGLALSGSFTHVTITRDYKLATGEAPSGTVLFTPSAWLLNNKVTIVAAARPAALDSEGRIRIDLAANNDVGTSPSGSHYVVLEQIIGQPDRSYKVIIPYDAGTTVELSTLPVIP